MKKIILINIVVTFCLLVVLELIGQAVFFLRNDAYIYQALSKKDSVDDNVFESHPYLVGRLVVSRVPWKSSGVASAELGYLSRLRVVKPERRGVIAFREAA